MNKLAGGGDDKKLSCRHPQNHAGLSPRNDSFAPALHILLCKCQVFGVVTLVSLQRLVANRGCQVLDLLVDLRTLRHLLGDFFTRVHHRRVITRKGVTNFW